MNLGRVLELIRSKGGNGDTKKVSCSFEHIASVEGVKKRSFVEISARQISY